MSYIGVNIEWLKQHDEKVRDKVLDIQKKILEDMNLMKFTARREGFDSVTLYDAQNIVKQRIGEFIRGEK